jgi:phosphoribosylaminoimidazolecarboxamide formyltransferase / IMP cyclohydrolase
LTTIKRVLISVSDKEGIVEFAGALHQRGIGILSTGGTAKLLADRGIPVEKVSDVTGYPEILGGRVKTLHPAIHGALLARMDLPSDTDTLAAHGIHPIDMVVVNLYPFEETVRDGGVSIDAAVEQIDIGGPTMIRAAAKNFKHRAVVVNPARYAELLAELDANNGSVGAEIRFMLAREAFQHVARYDAVIAQYFAAAGAPVLPEELTLSLPREMTLRYGENPHQKAALYGNFSRFFQQLHGKELSYNNILDLASAVQLAGEFDRPTVAIIKHNNPCGVASDGTLAEAYRKAFDCDRTSAFGGIVAVNRPLDLDTAKAINEIFTEVVVAPSFDDEVLDFLKKKKDRRIVRQSADVHGIGDPDIRSVCGGVLVQDRDTERMDENRLKIVTKRKPGESEIRSLLFAWRVAKHVKSNAIIFAREEYTVGIGAGQMSRVDSSKIAVKKARDAGYDLQGTVAASDGFFPFADGVVELARAGAAAVIQPGGSVRDQEVIDAADENGIAMAFTGIRHFRH